MELRAYPKTKRPIKIVQFGEGNFLRGFADYMIDKANEAGIYNGNIAVIKPTLRGNLDAFRAQNCNYTVLLRGITKGETVTETRVVTCIEEAIASHIEYDAFCRLARLNTLEILMTNVTEAGMVYDEAAKFEEEPPAACPARIAKFLFLRYTAGLPGLILLPLELIEQNGQKLKAFLLRHAAQWGLPEAFSRWIETECIFCDTLVDRILTGYPTEEAESLFQALGYRDAYLDAGEPFALWAIGSDRLAEVRRALPLDQAGLPVVFAEEITPYRERKVRVLNGAHTGSVLAGYLAGFETVGELLADPTLSKYMQALVYEEIVPNVPLPQAEVRTFADDMFDRFRNPFNRHRLLTISLNSVSKWRARLLPTLKDDLRRTGRIPAKTAFSLAALLAFYSSDHFSGDVLEGTACGRTYPITDDRRVLEFFCENSLILPAEAYVHQALQNGTLWGEDLTAYDSLEPLVLRDLLLIREHGVHSALQEADAT